MTSPKRSSSPPLVECLRSAGSVSARKRERTSCRTRTLLSSAPRYTENPASSRSSPGGNSSIQTHPYPPPIHLLSLINLLRQHYNPILSVLVTLYSFLSLPLLILLLDLGKNIRVSLLKIPFLADIAHFAFDQRVHIHQFLHRQLYLPDIASPYRVPAHILIARHRQTSPLLIPQLRFSTLNATSCSLLTVSLQSKPRFGITPFFSRLRKGLNREIAIGNMLSECVDLQRNFHIRILVFVHLTYLVL